MFFFDNAAHRGGQRLFFLRWRLFLFFFYAFFLRFWFFLFFLRLLLFFLGFFLLFCGLLCLLFLRWHLRVIDCGHHFADFYFLPFSSFCFQHTSFFGDNLGGNLIGLESEEHIARLYEIAGFFMPD